MSKKINIISIVSRASALAMIQAKMVGTKIKESWPEISIVYHTTKTNADIDTAINISSPGEVGIFTKDISRNIISGKHDIAVHSWKDLPVEPSSETEIIGTLSRGDMRDVLIMKRNTVSLEYKENISVLTSSPRRKFNLGRILPNIIPIKFKKLNCLDIRGNIETRLKKFNSGNADAIILAKIALDRLLEQGDNQTRDFIKGIINNNNWSILPLSLFPTAPGQGAIAIEAKKGRDELNEIIDKINFLDAFQNVHEEKVTLSNYGGGCHQKIGVSVWNEKDTRFMSLIGKTDKNRLLNFFGPEQKSNRNSVANDLNLIYPLNKDKKIFERNSINNSAKIKSIRKSIIYLSRKNVLDDITNIHSSNIIWSSGINCWEHAVSNGYWVNGTSDSFGEKEDKNIGNFIPTDTPSYKLSHERSKGDIHTLIPVYELSFQKEVLNKLYLENRTHFYWMSPIQFDIIVEHYPEIMNKEHSCGFGRTYDHIKERLPKGKNISRFHSYKSWLAFQKGNHKNE